MKYNEIKEIVELAGQLYHMYYKCSGGQDLEEIDNILTNRIEMLLLPKNPDRRKELCICINKEIHEDLDGEFCYNCGCSINTNLENEYLSELANYEIENN